MIVLIVVVVAIVLGIVATYALEIRNRRRNRRIAETTTAAGRGGEHDGMTNPIAAEGVMRGGYEGDTGGWG